MQSWTEKTRQASLRIISKPWSTQCDYKSIQLINPMFRKDLLKLSEGTKCTNLDIQRMRITQLVIFICNRKFLSTYSYQEQTLQLFLQWPTESSEPTMYRGFFSHSPLTAHWEQFGFWSLHSLLDGVSKDLTWIHLVADHFSPSITGQLPCKLRGSVVALRCRLKNNNASPFPGFTAYKTWTCRNMKS